MTSSKQKLTNAWVWLIFLILNGFFAYSLISQIIYKNPIGNHPAPNTVLMIVCLFIFGLTVLFKVMYLQVTVSSTDVHIKFFPFLNKYIPKSEIEKIEKVQYSPLRDYGGWGIRYGFKGTAYTINGNTGLSLTMKNGQNILIGINKNDTLES